jgi:phosphatidylinositol 3-kinase
MLPNSLFCLVTFKRHHREKSFEHPVVREFAVEILKSAADEELLTFLLQLVQALRYEPAPAEVSSVPKINNPSSNSIKNLQTTKPKFDVDSSSISNSKDFEDFTGHSSPPSKSSDNLSLLARFLIDRACCSPTVANYLYWYLKVETEDEVSGPFFQNIFDSFLVQLANYGEESTAWLKKLLALDDYILRILSCQREAREQGKRREGKEQCLIKLLESKGLHRVSNQVEWVPMPLNPKIRLTGLIPSTARMFASAIYPCVIEFHEFDEPNESESKSNKTYKMMFKSGDDLRQDQLIMQMISLMDSLLKKVNLDLKLLTYGILAVGQKDGRVVIFYSS